MVEVLGLIVGVVGLSWGINRDLMARRERRKREAVEEQLLRPDVTVELTGHSTESGGQGHQLATLAVENKGSNVASNVTFGLRYKGRELVAGNGGTPGTVPVLGEKERLKWTVRIPHDVMASLRTDEERIEAVMVPWARFLDKLGNQHEIEAEPLP